MFTNIGKKIKTLASVLCWGGIALSFVWGLLDILRGFIGENHSATTAGVAAMTGLFIMILGTLISWISSFVLYGFGELVDKTSEIHRLSLMTYNRTFGNASKPSSQDRFIRPASQIMPDATFRKPNPAGAPRPGENKWSDDASDAPVAPDAPDAPDVPEDDPA